MLLLSDMPAKESTNLASVQTLDGGGRHGRHVKVQKHIHSADRPKFSAPGQAMS